MTRPINNITSRTIAQAWRNMVDQHERDDQADMHYYRKHQVLLKPSPDQEMAGIVGREELARQDRPAVWRSERDNQLARMQMPQHDRAGTYQRSTPQEHNWRTVVAPQMHSTARLCGDSIDSVARPD